TRRADVLGDRHRHDIHVVAMPQPNILFGCPLRSATLRALLQGGPVKRVDKTPLMTVPTQMGGTRETALVSSSLPKS
ncbi:MAG TPA: hypothetical protein VLI06_02095, partial [Solimonas sp.]|nr:hypothetical protein [Solimonas sp.]